MKLPRLTVAKLLCVVALLALLMGFCIVPVGRQYEYVRLQRQMNTSIRYLQPTDPNINPAVWNCAHGWMITAYGNVCFSPGHVSMTEMYRLRDDLDRKLEGRIDLITLVWIWDRLAETGPHGKRFVKRFRTQIRERFSPQSHSKQ